MAKKSTAKWQYGDFQTPYELASKAVNTLKRNHDVSPDVIIEPTCGKGAFVVACYENFQKSKILGIDINGNYILEAKSKLSDSFHKNRVTLQVGDFFSTDWGKILSSLSGYLLIIGNPPWVTSSELGALNSKNFPEKSKFQNRKGIEAITGSGNFDISEWMLLQHVDWLSTREGTIAFLCKYSVARKIIRQVEQSKKHRFFSYIYPIETKTYFQASVKACLFVLTTKSGNSDCEIYESLDSIRPLHVIGERDGFIVSNIKKYEKWKHLKGQDPKYIWRSGIKHDCSKIMELSIKNGEYINGLGESVNIESEYLYPLLKGSDIGNGKIRSYRKLVIITQKIVGEDTTKIEKLAPETWKYLASHAQALENRKSSIYRGKPKFSIFGVGPYTFGNWKIAISAFYKKLKFNLVSPLDGKPVIFDDTINFLFFNSEKEASFAFELLSSRPAIEFLESMIFWDEKRPITTQVLGRLSLKNLANELELLNQYMSLSHYTITENPK